MKFRCPLTYFPFSRPVSASSIFDIWCSSVVQYRTNLNQSTQYEQEKRKGATAVNLTFSVVLRAGRIAVPDLRLQLQKL